MTPSNRWFNRSFFTGLVSGFILAAIIAIVFVSFYHPAPEQHKITGSMMDGNYVPSLGEHGMVVGYWEGMYPTPGCEDHWYFWNMVVFENDPSQYPIPVEVGSGNINVGVEVVCTNPSVVGQYCVGVDPPEYWHFPEVSTP